MGSGLLYKLKGSYYEIFNPPASGLPVKEYPDLTGTIALVTGASSGIGLLTTKLLVKQNCYVIIGVRNKDKAEVARAKMLSEIGDNDGKPVGQIDMILMDLANLETLKDIPQQLSNFTDHLDIIVHNAGVGSPKELTTEQGFDRTIGTNCLGTFKLQKYLDKFFLSKSSSPYKRLIWLTSAAQYAAPSNGGIDWDVLTGKKEFKSSLTAYIQSKVILIYFSYYWGISNKEEFLQKGNMISLGVHPGVIVTEISRDSGGFNKWLTEKLNYSASQGAEPVMFAALSSNLNSKDHQGAYIVPWGKVGELRDDIIAGFTNGTAEKVWKWLEETTSKY